MSNDEQAPSPGVERRLGLASATFVVVANMIGTGAFTTTGLLLSDLATPATVLVAWVVGGVLALFGALAYGELATTIARNGGEYRFLSDIYPPPLGPALGFVAGWVSLVVGFSAPMAASALAFGKYLHAIVPGVAPIIAGTVLVALVSAMHAFNVSLGAIVQNAFTLAKVTLILVFVVGAGWVLQSYEPLIDRETTLVSTLPTRSFAVGVIFVSFAYSGWNGAAYLAGEVREPRRTLPRALLIGTVGVTLLYVALNAAFVLAVASEDLAGVVEVGHVVAVELFGERFGAVLAAAIAIALVSSVSAISMVGPRVYEAIGEDYRALRFLHWRPRAGGPVAAIALQAGLAIVLLWTVDFNQLLMYMGFTLALFSALTVAGLPLARRRLRKSDTHANAGIDTSAATKVTAGLNTGMEARTDASAGPGTAVEPGAYHTWGYPVTPVVFVAFSLWAAAYSLLERPEGGLAGLATVAVGFLLYSLVRRSRIRPRS